MPFPPSTRTRCPSLIRCVAEPVPTLTGAQADERLAIEAARIGWPLPDRFGVGEGLVEGAHHLGADTPEVVEAVGLERQRCQLLGARRFRHDP